MGRFWMVWGVFIIGALTQAWWMLPPMEGSDEPLHVAYVLHLRAAGTLPDRTTYLDNCTRQQSGQPPLMYGLGAALLNTLRVPFVSCDELFTYYFERTNNRWLLTPDPLRREDNNTNFLPTPTISPPTGFPQTLHILRLIAVMFGALALLGAYLAAGEIFADERWRLTATAIFGFTPTMIHLSAYFTNDTPAIAFTTWAIWLALRVYRRGTIPRDLLLIGLLLGLGGLAKVSVLLASLPVALAVILNVVRTRSPNGHKLWRVVRAGVLIALPLSLTFGVWAGWGWITYGDPTGTSTHVHDTLNYDPPLGWGAVLRDAPDMFRTYVGLLGYANVYLHPTTYSLLAGLTGIALTGYLVNWRGVSDRAWLLIVLWAALFVGFLQWYRTIFDVTGRLMLPAHIAYALAITGGIYRWSQRLPRTTPNLRAVAAGTFTLIGLFVPPLALHHAYNPTLRTHMPPLIERPYDFDDTIRLLGYTPQSPIIQDQQHTITLCWEVLQPTTREAAYSVRYVKDGVPIAARTTVHGLGRYNSTLWQAGARFCDAVDMPIGDPLFGAVPPMPNTTYDILVVMLDARTLDVNWTATTLDGTPVAFPVLGQIAYP